MELISWSLPIQQGLHLACSIFEKTEASIPISVALPAEYLKKPLASTSKPTEDGGGSAVVYRIDAAINIETCSPMKSLQLLQWTRHLELFSWRLISLQHSALRSASAAQPRSHSLCHLMTTGPHGFHYCYNPTCQTINVSISNMVSPQLNSFEGSSIEGVLIT